MKQYKMPWCNLGRNNGTAGVEKVLEDFVEGFHKMEGKREELRKRQGKNLRF